MKKVNLTKALLVGASVAVLSTGATAGPNSQLKIADGASPKVQEQLTKFFKRMHGHIHLKAHVNQL